MGALTRYCRAGYDSVWIVSSTHEAAEFAAKIMRENALHENPGIRQLMLDGINMDEQKPSLIIVFESDLQAALATSKALNAFKDLHIPVVFGNARDVFFERPNVSQQGISYAGMFQICAAYLQGQKALAGAKLGYAEFGVFDGRTCSLAWQLLNGVIEDYYAFDSFQGILEKAEGEELYYQTGDYYANQQTFELNMRLCGVMPERLHAVPCDFDKDLNGSRLDDVIQTSLAVVHVDCDVYPAALHVLEYVTPHLAEGCILLFDDYDSMWGDPNKGEKRALSEWQANHPEFSVSEYRAYSATGRAFLCYRSSNR